MRRKKRSVAPNWYIQDSMQANVAGMTMAGPANGAAFRTCPGRGAGMGGRPDGHLWTRRDVNEIYKGDINVY